MSVLMSALALKKLLLTTPRNRLQLLLNVFLIRQGWLKLHTEMNSQIKCLRYCLCRKCMVFRVYTDSTVWMILDLWNRLIVTVFWCQIHFKEGFWFWFQILLSDDFFYDSWRLSHSWLEMVCGRPTCLILVLLTLISVENDSLCAD